MPTPVLTPVIRPIDRPKHPILSSTPCFSHSSRIINEEAEQKRLAARMIEPTTVKSFLRVKPSLDQEQERIEELMHPMDDPTRYTTAMAGRPMVADVTMSNGLKWQINMGLVSHIRWNHPGFLDQLGSMLGEPITYSDWDVAAKVFKDKAQKDKRCDILDPYYTLYLRPYYSDGKIRKHDCCHISWKKGTNIAATPGDPDYKIAIGPQCCPMGSFQYFKTDGDLGPVIWPTHMRRLFAEIQSYWDQAQEMKQNGKPIWSKFDFTTVRGKMHATYYGYDFRLDRFAGGWTDIPGIEYINPNNPLRLIRRYAKPEKKIPVYHVPTPIAHQGIIPRLEYVQPKIR